MRTSHPLGLLRCLVHTDGHVGMLANSAELEPRVNSMGALLDEVGVEGFRLEWLPLNDATERYAYGLACERCRIRVSCGCHIEEQVLTGRCPHGTAKAIRKAAQRIGYAPEGEQ